MIPIGARTINRDMSIGLELLTCVNIIATLKPYVTSQSLISIYYALVYPYLTYGCVLWGSRDLKHRRRERTTSTNRK